MTKKRVVLQCPKWPLLSHPPCAQCFAGLLWSSCYSLFFVSFHCTLVLSSQHTDYSSPNSPSCLHCCLCILALCQALYTILLYLRSQTLLILRYAQGSPLIRRLSFYPRHVRFVLIQVPIVFTMDIFQNSPHSCWFICLPVYLLNPSLVSSQLGKNVLFIIESSLLSTAAHMQLALIYLHLVN